MKYSNTYMMQLEFGNGVKDKYKHPYLVVLDRNNKEKNKLLLLQGKTFNPISHSRYVKNGESYGPVALKKDTIFNLIELCEIDDQSEKVFKSISFTEFKDISISLYSAISTGKITANSRRIYSKHKDDFEIRLKENGVF